VDGEELKEIEMKSTKDVTNALEEIAEGKIAYKISKADL
jgi:DNA-directed RNA polymerase subunit omega